MGKHAVLVVVAHKRSGTTVRIMENDPLQLTVAARIGNLEPIAIAMDHAAQTASSIVGKNDRVAVEVLDPFKARRAPVDERRENTQLPRVTIEDARFESASDQPITRLTKVDAVERHIRRVKADHQASAVVESHEAATIERQSLRPDGLQECEKKRMGVNESGHHVPAVRKSVGRPFEVARSDKTRPTLFPRGADPEHDHWRLHDAERETIGPRQGSFSGTDDQLFDAYRKAYSGLDDIKVDVKSPNGTYTLAEGVTPRQAVDVIQNWFKEQGLWNGK